MDKCMYSGAVFGRWTLLERDKSKNKSYWICQCSCGTKRSVRTTELKSGRSKSCGCLSKEKKIIFSKGQVVNNFTLIEKTEESNWGGTIWNCRCNLCNNTLLLSTQQIKNRHNCGCSENRTLKISPGQKFGLLTVLNRAEQQDKFNRALWECRCDCGSIKNVSASNLVNNKTISCGCIHSKGEEKIAKILRENNILFEREKIFENGKYENSNRNFRFDFYLPDYNLVIEFDGKQHFEPTSGNWDIDVDEIQRKDEYKDNWCKQYGIKIKRISYLQYDTLSIEDLLDRKNF